MKKPIIGIIAKNNDFDDGITIWYEQTLSSPLRCCLLENKAIPIAILPTKKSLKFSHTDEGSLPMTLSKQEKTDLITQIDMCDGIVLQGGQFSDPYEQWIAKYCFDTNKPLLGICAGYNNIIRGLGGKTKRDNKKDYHNRPDLKYAHAIKIDKNSKLFGIIKKEIIQTNSLHEYIADTLNNLDAVAWSDDGFIEAVENKEKTFFLGVKFHPELLYNEDKKHNQIIKSFVKSCNKK